MNSRQVIHDLGYAAGYRLYPAHPGLSYVEQVKLADYTKSSEREQVPLALFSNYRDGFVAGYSQAKREHEVK